MKIYIIRLIAVLVFLPLFGCEQLQQVDSALYQVSDGLTEKDAITGKRELNLYDRAEQIENGNKHIEDLLTSMDQQNQPYNENLDKKSFERISTIFDNIHSISHFRTEQWKPILIHDESFNAYTTGGTYIVINSGLEEQLSDDDQLAAVIAHEIAHTVAGHSMETLSYGILNKLGGSKSVDRESFGNAFTREKEEEADKISTLYLALAGYDPFAASTVWEDKLNKHGSGAQYPSTHPNFLDRANLNKRNAQKVLAYYDPGKMNTNFEQILDSNALWQKDDSEDLAAGQGGGLLALAETYMNAMTKKSAAKTEELEQYAKKIRIESAEHYFKIVESAPVGQNIWMVRMAYNGYTARKNLIWRGVFQSPAYEPLIIIVRHPQIIEHNRTFVLIFSDPQLDVNKQRYKSPAFQLDYLEDVPYSSARY